MLFSANWKIKNHTNSIAIERFIYAANFFKYCTLTTFLLRWTWLFFMLILIRDEMMFCCWIQKPVSALQYITVFFPFNVSCHCESCLKTNRCFYDCYASLGFQLSCIVRIIFKFYLSLPFKYDFVLEQRLLSIFIKLIHGS